MPTFESAIRSWPKDPQDSARRLRDTYGDPDEVTPSLLIWHEKAKPWKRTVLSAQMAHHEFPDGHDDYLKQTIDYRVPITKLEELGAYDGSIIVDRTRGELSARCGGTSMNFLAMNLAVEIVEGKRTAKDARRFYADVAKRYKQGDEDPYTQDFTFTVPRGNTGDPDTPIR
jgi:hypothetical protein